MDPSQENVRKRLLLLILANSKKKWRKKRKFVREKEKEKKKISLYRRKPHTSFDWLCITEINLIQSQKKTAFLNLLQTHPSVLAWFRSVLAELA